MPVLNLVRRRSLGAFLIQAYRIESAGIGNGSLAVIRRIPRGGLYPEV